MYRTYNNNNFQLQPTSYTDYIIPYGTHNQQVTDYGYAPFQLDGDGPGTRSRAGSGQGTARQPLANHNFDASCSDFDAAAAASGFGSQQGAELGLEALGAAAGRGGCGVAGPPDAAVDSWRGAAFYNAIPFNGTTAFSDITPFNDTTSFNVQESACDRHHPRARPFPSAYSTFHSHDKTAYLDNINYCRDTGYSRLGHLVKMESSDLAQQEAAARDYVPDIKGPAVGNKTSIHAITAEYAKADVAYVAKTMQLPKQYSYYRPILGDGNCGWRAIAFGYYEILLQSGKVGRLQAELTRLKSLDSYMENVGGHEPTIFELFTETTFALLESLVNALSTGHDAMEVLLKTFNDETDGSNLVYHMRLLASSYLKGHEAQYSPWVGEAHAYCGGYILPAFKEIEHVGLLLLRNVLLKPAGIRLEVAYLDRSPGDEVNVYPVVDDDQDAEAGVDVLRMLYRPDHYDLLYKNNEDVLPAPPAQPVALQVNRATLIGYDQGYRETPALDSVNMELLSLIPELASADMSASPTMMDTYTNSPCSPWMQQLYSASACQQASSPPPTTPQPTSVNVRFSKYNFPDLPEMAGSRRSSTEDSHILTTEPDFTTATFKNSHYNVAHYNNPNFQPEVYRPHDEEMNVPVAKGRKKSADHGARRRWR